MARRHDQHQDASGKVLNLAGMSDTHLRNTIGLFSQTMTEATKAMDSAPAELSRRAKALYGDTGTTMSPERYQKLVEGYYRKIGPYALEAALRGIDITDILQAALGRKGRDEEAPELLGTLKVEGGQIVRTRPSQLRVHERVAGLLIGDVDEDELDYEDED